MNRSKAKGTRWESDVVDYLRSRFPRVERRALSGNQDKGDISGVDGWTLEAKAERSIALSQYMSEAEVEAKNAGTERYAAIVKRRNHSTADAYVVLPLKVFISVINGSV